MAKIVSFTKALNRTRKNALDGFVDDGDLLEFSAPKAADIQASDKTQHHLAHHKSALPAYWSNQELADLYRAYSVIQSAQPDLECEHGISDEGDPWFLIGDHVGDVLVHICRIEGIYILDSVALPKVLKGKSFNALIEDFLNSVAGDRTQDAQSDASLDEPANVVRLARGGTVCLHPSVMLAALVWTLLMNADELTLPSSNGIFTRKGLDQGQDKDQDAAAAAHATNDDVTLDEQDPAGFKVDLAKAEKVDIGPDEFLNALSTTEMDTQKEEKHLHISAFSHALTTIAIAAGFYASAEAANAFWKSYTEMPDNSSDPLDQVETSDARDFTTPVDHLSDALAVLGNVVDLVVLETHENHAAEQRHAEDESAATLASAALELMEALKGNGGQQMLATSSELSKALAEASQTNASGTAGEDVLGAEKTLQADMVAGPYNTVSAPGSQEQTPDTSISWIIQGLTQDYSSNSLNVSRYDSLSLQSGLGKYNGELQQYSEVIDRATLFEEDDSTNVSEDEDTEAAFFRSFDDAARSLIDYKLANSDMDIAIFLGQLLYIEKGLDVEQSMRVDWQLEDGGVITMIGMSSDMAEFLVA